MTMATVAVSTVTVVATQRISRSWPARKATARGIAAGMAGRVSTDIGQAPLSFAGVDTQGNLGSRRRQRHESACTPPEYRFRRHSDKLFAHGSRIFAAIS